MIKFPGPFIVETYHFRRLMLLNDDFLLDYRVVVSFKSDYYTVLWFCVYYIVEVSCIP